MGVTECHCPYMTRTEGRQGRRGGGWKGDKEVGTVYVCVHMSVRQTPAVNSIRRQTEKKVREQHS